MWSTGQGWQEAVISVADIGRWVEALAALGNWRVLHRGEPDAALARHWRLADGTPIAEAVVAPPRPDGRWLRLVQIETAGAAPIRAAAQPWDSGGTFSLLIRTNDIGDVLQTAYRLGWGSLNDIDVMRFAANALRNVVLRGPDGANFGLYQSETGGTEPDRLSAPHTAQMMVRDIAAARRFFREVIGWTAWFDGETRLAINQFGMPATFAGSPKKVAIIHAAAGQYGQVELVQWVLFSGRDVAARALPPNRGHLALRWAVDSEQAERCRRAIGEWTFGPSRVMLAPFGAVTLCGVRTPDGALIELVRP
ncbi:MAG: VOC family protein [Alphaproteobacteria bacterium]|nr:VOC family protein [Alphaproteobacteria bacterium]